MTASASILPAPGTICISDLLLSAVRAHGNKTAIAFGEYEVTYSELNAASDSLAGYLAARGIGRGDTVALHLHNCIEYVTADLALMKLCAIKVPLNELMAPEEIDYCLEHSKARALIRHGTLPSPTQVPNTLAVEITLDEMEGSDEKFDQSWQEAMSFDSTGFVRYTPHAADKAVIAYTGGTTGKPKGVLHSQATLGVNLLAHVVCGDIRSDEVMLLTTPLPHSAGYHLHACLLQGGKAVLSQKFSPVTFVDMAIKHAVTWTFAVPTMIYRLLDHLQTSPTQPPNLRTVLYGAAPMSVERLEEALSIFGPIFLQIYGQTECPNFITTLSKTDHLDQSLLTSCGRPVPFLTASIVEPDGQEVKPGQIGEVRVHSPYNLISYYNNPQATAETPRRFSLYR